MMMIKRRQGYILRNIMGDYMLFPSGIEMQQFKGVIFFNELSTFIWNKLQEPFDTDDLVIAILEEYDVEEKQVKADLDKILNIFSDYGIVEYI